MARLPIVSWIGNAAAVFTGPRGAVSHQAHAVGCSRQTAYAHAEKVRAAVCNAAGGGPTRVQLQQELCRQSAEIALLKQRLEGVAEFPEEEQQRFAATATAMGLSYSQTRALLEIVVKKNAPVGQRLRGG